MLVGVLASLLTASLLALGWSQATLDSARMQQTYRALSGTQTLAEFLARDATATAAAGASTADGATTLTLAWHDQAGDAFTATYAVKGTSLVRTLSETPASGAATTLTRPVATGLEQPSSGNAVRFILQSGTVEANLIFGALGQTQSEAVIEPLRGG